MSLSLDEMFEQIDPKQSKMEPWGLKLEPCRGAVNPKSKPGGSKIEAPARLKNLSKRHPKSE